MRGDWRAGYERDPVLAATAANERGTYGSLGLRFGPLVVETNRNLTRGDAFGSARLLAEPQGAGRSTRDGSVGLQLDLFAPDVLVRLQGRWAPTTWRGKRGRGAWVLAATGGEPPQGASTERYVSTRQLTLGGEWESLAGDGVHPYLGAGLGWRSERVAKDKGDRASAHGGVATPDLGVRVDAYRFGPGAVLQLHLGLGEWLPAGRHGVTVDGTDRRLLEPGVAGVGGVFDLSPP